MADVGEVYVIVPRTIDKTRRMSEAYFEHPDSVLCGPTRRESEDQLEFYRRLFVEFTWTRQGFVMIEPLSQRNWEGD